MYVFMKLQQHRGAVLSLWGTGGSGGGEKEQQTVCPQSHSLRPVLRLWKGFVEPDALWSGTSVTFPAGSCGGHLGAGQQLRPVGV